MTIFNFDEGFVSKFINQTALQNLQKTPYNAFIFGTKIMTTDTLPNIDFTGALDSRLALIDFHQANAHTLSTLTQQALDAATQFLDTIEQDKPAATAKDALDIIHTFDALNAKIERYFGILSHLNSTASTDAIRHAHHEILPKISAFGTKVGQSAALYALYRLAYDGFDTLSLPNTLHNQAQKQALKKALQSFELSGVALDDNKKARFADIQSQLSLLSAKFADNVLDATASFWLPLTQEQLSGLSDGGLALLKAAGERYKANHPTADMPSDYVATLDMPCYLAVIQFADDRALRETLYHAYHTRASDMVTFDAQTYDNSDILTQIIALRTQKAQLLGFDDYTQYSLATKMADSSTEVESFLLSLSASAKPVAQKELDELTAFARTLGIDELQPWDVAYVSEKLRHAKFSLTQDELRPYFPLPTVLLGLFDICQTLFGIHIKAVDSAHIPVWHEDVLFFTLHDTKTEALLGGVYLDLFARAGKRGGAWLDGWQNRHQDEQGTRLPVGFIVANFAPPLNGKPSQLSFDEVTTLFHEFGHGLHHLLTEVGVSDVAGINGVEWDAVELPSQFMENFALEADGIAHISAHVDTGAPLPQDKLNALILAKNFQKGCRHCAKWNFLYLIYAFIALPLPILDAVAFKIFWQSWTKRAKKLRSSTHLPTIALPIALAIFLQEAMPVATILIFGQKSCRQMRLVNLKKKAFLIATQDIPSVKKF